MKLLKSSSYPPHHNLSGDPFSLPASTFRRRIDHPAMSQTPDIAEEEGSACRGEKVYVAVGKSLEKSVGLLQWSSTNFAGQELCLLHVHQPSPTIPTLLGKLPASQASAEVLSSYRKEEKENTEKLLQKYISICGTKVKASFIVVEVNHVPEGIINMVNIYGIRKLVMGAETENCIKVKWRSSNAYHAAKSAPSFCEIFFIHKGKHLWTRKTSESSSSLRPCIQPTSDGSLRSKSLEHSKKAPLFSSECLWSSSTRAILCNDGVSSPVQSEQVKMQIESSPLLSTSISRQWLYNLKSTNSPRRHSTGSDNTFGKLGESTILESEVEEERFCNSLIQARIEAEESRKKLIEELKRRIQLESTAMEAINRVKILESAHAREVKLRKQIEDALRTTINERENLLKEREELTRESQNIMRNIALLNSRTQVADHRHDEATNEFNQLQDSVATLWQEKQRILRQKKEAERWLSRWSSRGVARTDTFNSFLGFVEEIPRLAEFSLSDLQTATCNFSESFMITQGGYGCVYKGEMMGRTVLIKKLHPHNKRGQSEFEQEVRVLGNLKHPHLVTLLGHCSDAQSLVYEYLPNGNLQDFLSRKKNCTSLAWKTRARIISEIGSALCFLHSSKPEMIVHGDLQPGNILLDSDLVCKICHFGLCRLVREEILHCPSFLNTEPKSLFQYLDPEFHRRGILTPKSDVYSFGLIILQLLTGKSPVGLASYVRKTMSQGNLTSILDISAGEWPTFVAKKLAELGLQFCELSSQDRPDLTPALVKELGHFHMSEERVVPHFFLCPILQEIMHDPQIGADGFTYEGEALQGWIESGHDTSPMTNLKLSHLHLVPNHSLRLAIQDWLCRS